MFVLKVTPYAGVWIEIGTNGNQDQQSQSFPTRECGLKC